MSTATKPTLIAVADGASSLDVLAARHRAAWDKTQHGRSEWIEGTLELAAVLAEERSKPELRENMAFSRWLEGNSLAEMDKNVRAALIQMAKHPGAARAALEKTERSNWRLIWEREIQPRVSNDAKTRQAPAKRASKLERQLIDQVLKLHCDRGHSYKETAEELGLTIGKVASMVRRFGNTRNEPPPPKPIREYKGLDSKTLTREQVDPDFKGDAVQFATKYGHVLLHTKEQIEENKRQEDLAAWLASVSDLEQAARGFVKLKAPDQNTLRQYLAKPGKAERLDGRLTAIESACRIIASCLPLVRSVLRSQHKS